MGPVLCLAKTNNEFAELAHEASSTFRLVAPIACAFSVFGMVVILVRRIRHMGK